MLPFTAEDIDRIRSAFNRYTDNYVRTEKTNALRLRALVLLLRHSGLRIGDAVALRRNRLCDGKLLLYTHKAGFQVYLPLPQTVVDTNEDVENAFTQNP